MYSIHYSDNQLRLDFWAGRVLESICGIEFRLKVGLRNSFTFGYFNYYGSWKHKLSLMNEEVNSFTSSIKVWVLNLVIGNRFLEMLHMLKKFKIEFGSPNSKLDAKHTLKFEVGTD